MFIVDSYHSCFDSHGARIFQQKIVCESHLALLRTEELRYGDAEFPFHLCGINDVTIVYFVESFSRKRS